MIELIIPIMFRLLVMPRWRVSVEAQIVAVALFWALFLNGPFLNGLLTALYGSSEQAPAAMTWQLRVWLVGVHSLVLGLLVWAPVHRWLLVAVLLSASSASYFSIHYSTYFDTSMMRNIFATDVAESRELLGVGLVWHLFWSGVLPSVVVLGLGHHTSSFQRAAARRLMLLIGALVTIVAVTWVQFQPLSSAFRNQRELRYLITPANVLWSSSQLVAQNLKGAAKPREPIGLDAKPGPSWAQRTKPMIVVMVVGETARAANWGLNGYARNTTPELSKLPLWSFQDVTACGTSTEVSLPCMFAPVGRRDYSESTIRGQQSLLHVLDRAGVKVTWVDNQSGCKGVCEGLPHYQAGQYSDAKWCSEGRCLDHVLLDDLRELLKDKTSDQMILLHMLGNHGPSYYKRHTPEHTVFAPECTNDELSKCEVPHIVNAYDNALLTSDHVLAEVLKQLQAAQDVDTALLFVSDHGESLGENGLFLHGVPFAIAPDVQKKVPMFLWAKPGFEQASGLKSGCMADRLTAMTKAPVMHDHLFHTFLGMWDVKTQLYDPAWDVLSSCR